MLLTSKNPTTARHGSHWRSYRATLPADMALLAHSPGYAVRAAVLPRRQLAPFRSAQQRRGLRARGLLDTRASERTDFCDREDELSLLTRRLTRRPEQLLVLTGATNCGKSRLLRVLAADMRGLGRSVFFINCRRTDFTKPESYAQELQELAASQLRRASAPDARVLLGLSTLLPKLGIKISLPLPAPVILDFTVHAPALLSPGVLPLRDIMRIYSDAISAAGALGKPAPIFIVDEVNRLCEWPGTEESQLRSLLQFFVGVAKEQNAAHVLLSTSDAFFPAWLERYICRSVYTPLVMGNLPEKTAREYYRTVLQREHPSSTDATNEDVWARISGACGGNPGAMNSLAALDSERGSLDMALNLLCRGAEDAVSRGLRASSGCGWSHAQYVIVARKLLAAEAPEHAVDEDELIRELGQDGVEALAALLRTNLLGFRGDAPMTAPAAQPRRAFTPFAAAHVAVWRTRSEISGGLAT